MRSMKWLGPSSFVLCMGLHIGSALAAPAGDASACGQPPAPVDHLSGESVYEKGDPTNSHVNAGAQSTYNKGMAPLWAFVKYVSAEATSYEQSSDKQAAMCAVGALSGWASAGALQHLDSRTARLNFGRNLAGIALAYKKVRGTATPDQKASIDSWLKGLGQMTTTVFDGDQTKTPMGNLRYWNGLGAAAVGDVVDDTKLFDWGMEALRIGLCQADADGALPLEMARGQKALDYQTYATSALVMLAKLSKEHGQAPEQMCGGALGRIVTFTVAASKNPGKIEAKSHVAPAGASVNGAPGAGLAWLKAYQSSFGPIVGAPANPQADDPFLGGNIK